MLRREKRGKRVVAQATPGTRIRVAYHYIQLRGELEARSWAARHGVYFCLGFEITGRIALEIRVIPGQSGFANLMGSRMNARNNNSVVAALAPDDLGRQGIDSPKATLERHVAVCSTASNST